MHRRPELCIRQPRHAAEHLFRWLVAIFLAIVLEGALRKWLLPPSLDGPAFLAKDVLAIAFCWSHPVKRSRPVLGRLLDIWLLVAALLIVPFLVGAHSYWQSALIVYKNAVVWPIFALHLAPRLTRQDIRAFCRVLAGAATLMAILAVMQYRSPAGHWINAYAWDNVGLKLGASPMGLTTTGIRAAGTFSYITGLTAFSIVTFNLMIWQIASAEAWRERLWASTGLLMAICCGVTAGGRAALAYFLLTTVLTLLFAGNVLRTFRVFVVLTGAVVVLVGAVAPDAARSLFERTIFAEDSAVDRITGAGLNANPFTLMINDPVGLGLGQFAGFASLQRGQATGDFSMGYEDRLTEAVFEGGAFGWAATWVIILACVWMTVQGLRSQSQRGRQATAAVAVGSLYAVSRCLWYDHTSTALHWLALGLCMALWLERGGRHTSSAVQLHQTYGGLGGDAVRQESRVQSDSQPPLW